MLKHYKALSLCAAVALTAVSVLAVTPVHAQEPFVVTAQRDLPTQWVSYRDLNLAGAAGQATLMRRVGNAVSEVCFERDERAERTLKSRGHYETCRDFAWDGARPQLAAAIGRAQAMALNGTGATAVGSLAISVSAPAGA